MYKCKRADITPGHFLDTETRTAIYTRQRTIIYWH